MMISSKTIKDEKLYNAGVVQRREWMLHKIRPDQYPFNVQIHFRMDAPDLALVQQVVGLLAEKHEILRTTLRVVNGDLKQVVHAIRHYPLTILPFDYSMLHEKEALLLVDEKVAASLGAPFNFETGPLFRVLVFQMPGQYSLVYFIFHHVIFDQHSAAVFASDLQAIYSAVLRNTVPVLQQSMQYRHYAHFEMELLETDKGAMHRQYWKKTLANGLPDLQYINSRKRQDYGYYIVGKVERTKAALDKLIYSDERLIAPVIRRFLIEDAGEISYVYDATIMERVRLYREDGKNGLLSLMTGSLLLAFHALGDQDQLAFEIIASRRTASEFQQTIGWLSTAGPCYFENFSTLSPKALLQYIDQQLYDLSRHCIYPWETTGYEHALPLGCRMPVFISLSYIDGDLSPLENGITDQRTHGSGTYQDIAFFVMIYANAMVLKITYNNDLLQHDQVTALLDQHLISLNKILNGVS